MSTKKNSSSIKTTSSEKMAARSNQDKNSVRVGFSQSRYENEQVINARKGANLELAKTKAKKKAKLAKASKRKNK
ncbi:MAG: hypothetical protein HRT41_03445 [Campylobacteraceae bacterium]|nr:hypothetical protein [Campylobacteraceae bacterium]